mmetsp:Transcript_127352/g.224244  ORF Transcript_127352/g.224244 Transcript_127352/m.224244 type:complete len:211 (+) Transcript_127352:553-1185(+)
MRGFQPLQLPGVGPDPGNRPQRRAAASRRGEHGQLPSGRSPGMQPAEAPSAMIRIGVSQQERRLVPPLPGLSPCQKPLASAAPPHSLRHAPARHLPAFSREPARAAAKRRPLTAGPLSRHRGPRRQVKDALPSRHPCQHLPEEVSTAMLCARPRQHLCQAAEVVAGRVAATAGKKTPKRSLVPLLVPLQLRPTPPRVRSRLLARQSRHQR